MRTLRWATAIVLLLSMASAASARALSLQPIGTFDSPIYATSDPGEPDRLFVVERDGTIELVEGSSVSTFVDLSSAVACSTSCLENTERGLLSIALAPDFDASHNLYVDYAAGDTGDIHVARLTADSSGESAGSLKDLLIIPHPGESNHNGGQLQFGPGGDLYISTGDGGGGGDQHHNSQSLNSLLGKVLRIRPNPGGPAPYYTVPTGNPFAAAAAPYDTIWGYGLRNPFRFSFDRSGDGMVIGDVGQNAREEIDYAPAPDLGRGANYGWNCWEGLIGGPATDPQCASLSPVDFTSPVFDYPHNDPGGGAAHGCAIIGGYVVRDASLGGLYGHYLYADLCVGEIRSLGLGDPLASDSSTGLQVDDGVISFGEDSCGRLYVVSGGGEVDRLVGDAPASCPPPRKRALVRIGAEHSRVKRGRRALITVAVLPCLGRQGEQVRLLRGGRPTHKRLDRACVALFHPRIRHRSSFRAFSPQSDSYHSATSRRLTIRVLRKWR